MSQSDRNYRLTIKVSDSNVIVIEPPMGVVFDAAKSAAGFGLNTMNVAIFNLAESERLAIVKDPEQSKRIPITLEVGYGDNLELIYKGTVHRGVIGRRGPEIIVSLECIDGGFDAFNSFTSRTVKGRGSALEKIISDMPNTTIGKITIQDDSIRPHVIVGASFNELAKYVNPGEQFFVDNEKIYIMKESEVVSMFAPRVSFETGLINTPERENSIVTFESQLNPALRIAGLCTLESLLAPYLNGVYKINTMNYNGDYYGADWKQTVSGIQSPNYQLVAA